MEIRQSSKLKGVCYEIRGPIADQASALEAAGHNVLRLNTGNPAAFGFEVPDSILQDMVRTLSTAHGYSDSRGILSARRAVAQSYEDLRFTDVDVNDIYLGNGVSELATMSIQALVDNGDEVLIPSPDYPLWTAITKLAGGTPVHYLCDEDDDWQPSLADIEAKVSARTKAIVVINPNNPTGAVYSREILDGIIDVARRNNLIILADEVYDKIVYDDAVHHSIGAIASDVMVLTFGGLSKSYRVAGFRSGWMIASGPRAHARDYLEGLTMLCGMRLCPNVPGQHAIQAALGGYQSIGDLVLPGGRLREQRDRAWTVLNEIPGVSCVKPQGAIYAFPRIDPEVYPILDDEKFVLDLLKAEKIHIVQGTGFNLSSPDHLRIVTLPHADDLEAAIRRIGDFLATYC